MAEGINHDHPDHFAMQPLPLTTSYNEVGQSDLLLLSNNFNVERFSALQYLSWLQSSIRMYSPQMTPSSYSYHEQSVSSLMSGDCSHNFSVPRTPTFDRQNISSSNLLSTFSTLMSTFSASRLTVNPYRNLPYITHAPIPPEKAMLPASAFQRSMAEYSSLFYQKQMWQQAISGRQSLMEIERFMTSNTIYNFDNTKKALLDTTNANLLDQSSVGSTIESHSMGTTVYTPPPSPRKVPGELTFSGMESKETDVHPLDKDTNLTENVYHPDRGRKRKNPTSNVYHNDYEKTFYTCKWESCGKKFNRSVNLLSHQRTHHDERPSTSKMESCEKRYKPRQYLKHVDKKPFICRWQFCKKSYKRLSYYLRHEQAHGNVRPSTDLQSRRNKYKSLENSQKYPHHSHRKERIFVCKVKSCGKSYKRLHHLQRHEVSHTGERNFVCKSNSCGKSYMRLDNLQRHEISHTGIRPFACSWNFCGKNYKRRDHLKRHELIHTGEPFVCESPSCGKRFFRSDHFQIHQYTHSNEKRFKCNLCQKQYKRLKNLRYHEKTHSMYSDEKNNRRRFTRSSSSSFRSDGDNGYLVRSRSHQRNRKGFIKSSSLFQNDSAEDKSNAKRGDIHK